MEGFCKIGHRGAKAYLAENTLESIEKALGFKVDAVEVDVHKCKTGELVVIHDFALDRTTSGSGEIARASLEEIKALKIEGKYKIPLLTEVLEVIEGKCGINIELKGSATAVETAKIIQWYISERNWKYDNFIISSFKVDELAEIQRQNKNIPLAVLNKSNLTEAVKIGRMLNASAIHPFFGIVNRENVQKIQEAGFRVNVWTVNDPQDILRMKNFKVDGIISDFPDRL